MSIKQILKGLMKINVVAIIIGLIFGSFSFVPTITAETVYKTLAFDKKIETQQDFAGGQFDNVAVGQSNGKTVLGAVNGKGGIYISPVVEAPFGATHIGLHWEEELPEGADIVVYLRTGGDGENFSEWVQTTVEDDIGPNGFEEEETFAALVGTKKANFAQAKVEFIPGKGVTPIVRSLTLTFLNSAEESEQTVRKLSFASRAVAEGVAIPKTSPNGQLINVISREEWGADETLRMDGSEESWPRSYHGTRKLVVHHTAGDASNGEMDLAINIGTVKNIYYYHAVTRGWGDIGYNALVDAAGNIYEGRYGTHDAERTEPTADEIMVLDVDAGHVSSYNSGSFGVSALGDFTDFDVPETQAQALEDVLAYVADSRGIDTQGQSDFLRYDDVWHYDLPNVFAHRDAGATECPGDILYGYMNTFKTDVANRMLSNISGLAATADMIPAGNASGENIGPSIVTVSWEVFAGAVKYEYVLEKVFGVVDVASTSEPWNVAWFFPENTNVTITSNNSVVFDTAIFEDESEYVFYVRALNASSTPVSAVSHVDFLKNENTIIVDNLEETYTSSVGEWTHSTNVSGYYGQDYQPNAAGNGSDVFEWSPNIFKDGYYDVSVMYTAGFDRDRKAPYTVFYKDEDGTSLEDTILISQKVNGGVWVSLGNYYFEIDGVSKVQLSDDIRRGFVIADAVKFVFDRPADGGQENQSPVADAGADQNVLVGTEVLFGGSGSTDDGAIVNYEWNFGDGATGSGVAPTNVYDIAGEYTVTLMVTDDGGLTDDDSMIVTVTEDVAGSDMSVSSIDMALKYKAVFISATALVTIVDADGVPVSGATVSGIWSGLTNNIDSVVTDINGQVIIESNRVKSANGIYTFTVDNVEKSGWTYDIESNIETSDSISTAQ